MLSTTHNIINPLEADIVVDHHHHVIAHHHIIIVEILPVIATHQDVINAVNTAAHILIAHLNEHLIVAAAAHTHREKAHHLINLHLVNILNVATHIIDLSAQP